MLVQIELEVWSLRADKHRIKVLVEFGRGRVVGVCCSGGGLANEKIDFFCNRYYTYFTYPLSIGFDTVARSKTIWPKIQQEHEKKQKREEIEEITLKFLKAIRCYTFAASFFSRTTTYPLLIFIAYYRTWEQWITGGPSGVDLEKKMVKEENLQLPVLAEDVIECHGGEESDGLARGDWNWVKPRW